jgi:hypothetical protein
VTSDQDGKYISNIYQNNIKNIVVKGDYLFAYENIKSELLVYDITNKSAPILKNRLKIYGTDDNMIINGNYIYMSQSSGIVKVIDISVATSPKIVFENVMEVKNNCYNYTDNNGNTIYKCDDTTYSTSIYDTIYDLKINNNTLYAKFDRGFYILDITNPTKVTLTAKYNSSNNNYGYGGNMLYDDGKIYLPNNYLEIVDVSDSSNPKLISTYSNQSDIKYIDTNGTNIFFTTTYSLYITTKDDIFENIEPSKSISFYNTNDFKIINNKLYISNNDNFALYDTNLTNIYNTNTQQIKNIYIDNNNSYIYLAQDSNGFSIYNDNNNSENRLNTIGYNASKNDFKDIVIKDNKIYLANNNAQYGLKIYDIVDSNISLNKQLNITNSTNTNQSLNKLLIYEDNLFGYNNNFIIKYDTNNITQQPIKNDFSNSNFIDMTVDKNYMYILNNYNNSATLNIINHKTMQKISSLTLSNNENNQIAKQNNTIYISTSKGISIIDISDINNTIYKSTLNHNSIHSMFIKDDELYLSTNNTLIKYDLSDSLNPLKNEILNNTNLYNMRVYKDTIYATSSNYSNQLDMIDTNSLHQKSYNVNVEKLNILYGDNKYLYEYGTISRDIFGEEIDKKVMIRIPNNQNNNNYNEYDNKGQYEIDGITKVRSLGDYTIIVQNDKFQIVSFDNYNKATINTNITFSNTIDIIETLEDKNTLYIHIKDSKLIKVYDIKDVSNIKKIQEFNTDVVINSLYFKENKVYISSKDYGAKILFTDDKGLLIHQKNFENIGVNINNIYSVSNTSFNYSSSPATNSKTLNVFILQDRLTNGSTNHIYSISDTNTAPKEGCFIATASYGSYFEPNVKILRDFRDNILMGNFIGKQFVEFYYKHSPSIAHNIAQNELAKASVRAILTPIVYTIKYPLVSLFVLLLLFLYIFKTRFKHLYTIALSILFVSIFSGCDSTSYSEEKAPSQAINSKYIGTGYFIDSAVEGISYRSGKISGITTADGKFQYDNTPQSTYNTDISFSIGNIKLGTIQTKDINADKKLFPSEILNLDRNNTSDEKLIAMIRLLQTLDEDDDPTNGITISSQTNNKLEQSSIDFNTDINITNINDKIESIFSKQLILPTQARLHYENSINEVLINKIDTVGALAPSILNPIYITNQNSITISLIGESNTTVYIDNNSTNQTIDENITLNMSTQDGNKTFIIQLHDSNNNKGDILKYTILKDTIQPRANIDTNISIVQGATYIITIDATDTNQLLYTIKENDDSQYFVIDKNRGAITLKTPANYSTKSSYTIEVDISDGINHTIKRLYITVKNPNDTYISNITTPQIKTYNIYDTLEFVVQFNHTIDFNGTAYISLDINNSTYKATSYENTTQEIKFRYSIPNNLIDKDGISISNQIYLDINTTLKDDNDDNISLTIPKVDLSNIQIDSVTQAPTNITIDNDTIYDSNKIGDKIATLSTTDSDSNSFTYRLTSGAGDSDNGSFTIAKNILYINTTTDASVKNKYYIRINTYDNANNYEKKFIINIKKDTIRVITATYTNNQTTDVTDDKLYIYFNYDIDPSTISSDMSGNYDTNGTGAIDSSSSSSYISQFAQHIISLNNNGTPSIEFNTTTDTISLNPQPITKSDGTAPTDFTKVKIQNLTLLTKTGDINTNTNYSDGYYKFGINGNYTKTNNIVTDHITNLMWQDDSEAANTRTTWQEAQTYCSNLTLDGYTNWYLPSIKELLSIVDYGKQSPSANSIFDNFNSYDYYWSSTSDASDSSQAWSVYYSYGYNSYVSKSSNRYVRCVKEK